MNKDFIDLRLKATKAKEKADNTKSQTDLDVFRQLRNSLNTLACKLKQDYFTNIIDETDKVWVNSGLPEKLFFSYGLISVFH